METSRAAPTRRHRKSLRQLTPLRLASETDPAFEQLYRRHAREVYQYALALLTNPADAEDVTQTTFMNAYRAYQRGERPQRPHNWLIAITHNVCRMRWRQANHRPREVPLEEAREPVALEHERPELDEVLTALARLSFNQRAALVMRELEGRNYREIASTLDLSMSAVEALIFRARRNLQLRRRALSVLTTAPLPGSLSSLFGAGGGAVAAGGAAVGTDLVLKAVAILAAGAVTAGVGYESVKMIPGHARTQAEAQRRPVQVGHSAVQARLAAVRAGPTARARGRPALRRAVASKRTRGSIQPQPAAQPVAAAQVAALAPVSQAQSTTQQLGSTAAATATATATAPPLPAPVPQPPPVNVPAATIPALPALPALPPLPVTVATPVLPPPPLK
jgi:RNA polymerase sigma factor (sigma-70 family)